MTGKAVFLVPEEMAEKILGIAECETDSREFARADSLEVLIKLFEIEEFDLLFSFGTSVIVPDSILSKPNLTAVNLHAAPPQYPGRDPHHFAVYDGASQYGATFHFMTASVDAGPIIDVELFHVPDGALPIELRDNANEAAYRLLAKYLPPLLAGVSLSPNPNLAWAGKKRSRKDFQDLCRIDLDVSEEEFKRRERACMMPGYSNLYTIIQGRRFQMSTNPEE
jgi:methionyl-tRNA formyltransferase